MKAPILEKLMDDGYTVAFSRREDQKVHIRATHPSRNILDSVGQTATIALIVLNEAYLDWLPLDNPNVGDV